MLIEFRAANHRSLRDEQVLTMEAGRVRDDTDPRPRKVPGYPQPLLTVAGLYGANASGKSNVLAALAFMRAAVLWSHSSWEPDMGIPREPFAWGPQKKEPSLFEVTFLLDGVRYQYGFQAGEDRFVEEWLHAWPKAKKQVWFERDEKAYRFGENLRGENKLIEGVTRPNALFLSAAVQHNHPQLVPIFSRFRSFRPVNMPKAYFFSRRVTILPAKLSSDLAIGRLLAASACQPSAHREDESPCSETESPTSAKWRFLDLLRKADLGIADLRADKDRPDDKGQVSVPRFFLKHQGKSKDAWLPLEEESQGTQTLFHMILPILDVLDSGGVLLVDELERSLHPALAREIIRQFNDPKANPKNAQIVFATHDTNLLGTTWGEPALRRDQVWLTEKDPEGATVLYPLTDYKPRKAENIERGYLQGRYGAIPFLGDFLVAAESQ